VARASGRGAGKMSRDIRESDWKLFRELRTIAPERFCQQVLNEIDRLASDPRRTSHEQYLAVFRLLQRRDRELADAFNDLRRSTALRQLACIQSHKLLTEDEMARFSPDVRDFVQWFLETQRA